MENVRKEVKERRNEKRRQGIKRDIRRIRGEETRAI